MRKIIVLNQKGGVGKTTTVANLGAGLALLGRRVLLVDADPQANLSLHFGVEIPRGEPSLYTLLREEDAPGDIILPTPVNDLSLIPAGIDLAGLGVELSGQKGRHLLMRRMLGRLPGQYDYVIVDSPPSLGIVTLNALCAMEEVFIPLQTEFFALQGLGKLLSTVRRIRKVNTKLRITGVIACMHDARTCLAKEILDEIKDHFGPRVFKTVVRKNVRLAEAPGFGLPIMQYDPDCHGAEDYTALAEEVAAMEAAGLPAAPEHAVPRSMAG
ncbi:MAG: ParA family protein [Candidatus Brocadiia bacterium]